MPEKVVMKVASKEHQTFAQERTRYNESLNIVTISVSICFLVVVSLCQQKSM